MHEEAPSGAPLRFWLETGVDVVRFRRIPKPVLVKAEKTLKQIHS